MMKLISPSIFMMMYHNNSSLIMFSSIIMLILFTLKNSQNNPLTTENSMMILDSPSTILTMLTMTSTILIILSSKNSKTINLTILMIMSCLLITFSSSNMILFYIFFEITLIPTLIIITKKGKQPERLQAGLYMIMYTITASLPLLVTLLSTKTSLCFTFMTHSNLYFYTMWPLMLAFLIKSPMFITHLWLPKAHVEAPFEGSMILASILLKLGGYGLIRFSPLILFNLNKMNHWIISISLTGLLMTSMICIRQKDMKSLIAYSSVSHMAMALAGLTSLSTKGLNGAMLMMISHGLISSGLFLLTNFTYHSYQTRNTLAFKGLLTIFPNITMWWFLFIIINMAVPPSLNTMSEIMILSSMMELNMKTLLIIPVSMITVTTFSINLFINMSHNSSNTMKSNKPHQTKLFLSLLIHILPPIMLFTKMELL